MIRQAPCFIKEQLDPNYVSGRKSRLRFPAQMALPFLKTSVGLVSSLLTFFLLSYDNILLEVCFSKNWSSVPQENWVDYLHLKTGKECKILQEGLLFPKSRVL